MADHLGVGASLFAEPGDLVHEADAGGQHGVGGILGHLRGACIHEDDAVAGALKRGIELRHQLFGACIVGADDDAVGAEEVADGDALFEELRVGDNGELGLGATGDDAGDQVGGADGNGGLVDDDLEVGEVVTDGLGDGLHILEVCGALVGHRGADGDEDDLALADGGSDIGGEGEPALGLVADDDVVEAGLVDGELIALEHLDFAGIDIGADDRVADIGKAGASNQTHISRTDHTNLHLTLQTLFERRLWHQPLRGAYRGLLPLARSMLAPAPASVAMTWPVHVGAVAPSARRPLTASRSKAASGAAT